jgi:hypothetical protein
MTVLHNFSITTNPCCALRVLSSPSIAPYIVVTIQLRSMSTLFTCISKTKRNICDLSFNKEVQYWEFCANFFSSHILSPARGSVTNNNGFRIGWIYWHFDYNYNQLWQITVKDCLKLAPFLTGPRVSSLPLWRTTNEEWLNYFFVLLSPATALYDDCLTTALFRVRGRVRVRVTLRLAVYRHSVRPGTKPLETHDQVFFFRLNTCSYSAYVISSHMKGWVCHLQLLLVLASAVMTYFTVSNTRLPQPGGPGPHIYVPQE